MITDVRIITYTTTGKWNQEIFVRSQSFMGDLIDDDYELDYALEFNEVWDFIASSIDLKFDDNFYFPRLFSKEALASFFYGLEIDVDGHLEFWGYIDPESVEYDDEEEEWSLTASDFITYYMGVFENLGCQKIKHIRTQAEIDAHAPRKAWADYADNYTIKEIFNQHIEGTLLKGVRIEVGGIKLDLDLSFWQEHISQDSKYRFSDFVKEAQKHYGAYIFVNKDKELVFASRNTHLVDKWVDMSEHKIKATYSPYKEREYNAVAFNAPFVYWQLHDDTKLVALPDEDGFYNWSELYIARCNKNGGFEFESCKPYYGDRSEIEEQSFRKYGKVLDLSQKWNDYGEGGDFCPQFWKYLFFADFTLYERLVQYKNILFDHEVYEMEVDGYDYNLLDRVKYDNKNFIVHGVKKQLSSESATLMLREEL